MPPYTKNKEPPFFAYADSNVLVFSVFIFVSAAKAQKQAINGEMSSGLFTLSGSSTPPPMFRS
jgi:hypothetical protein